jgi:hypothetical protein
VMDQRNIYSVLGLVVPQPPLLLRADEVIQ